MNKKYLKYKLVSIFLLIVGFHPSYGQWSYDTLAEKKGGMSGRAIGNKILFFSGAKQEGSVGVLLDQAEVFNVTDGTKQVFTLSAGVGRGQAASATAGSKVVFAGGDAGNPSNKVDIYDTLTGLWTTAALSLDRWQLAGAGANGKVFFGGGWSKTTGNVSDIVDIYDVNANSWTSSNLYSTSTPPARENLTAVSLGNKVFFAGGDVANNSFHNMVNIYNTQTNQWLPLTYLSQYKSGLTSLVYKNAVYFVGGNAKANNTTNVRYPSDTIDIYDNATNSWSVMKIPHLMSYHTGGKRPYGQSAQAGCKMFLVPFPDPRGTTIGPFGNSDSIAVYDFARSTWTYLALPHPRTGVTIAAAQNKVYFAGGVRIDNSLALNDIDIFTLSPKLQLTVYNTVVSEYDFGSDTLHSQSNIALQLSNEGDYDLLFKNDSYKVVVTGDTADFTVDTSSITSVHDTLHPADTLYFPVTFHPTATGNHSITIQVFSNDPVNPVYSFVAKGTGTIPVTTSVQDAFTATMAVRVYPNPVTNILNIETQMQETLHVTLVNSQGIIMKEGTSTEIKSIDLSSFPSGLYFLKLSGSQSNRVVKVVKN